MSEVRLEQLFERFRRDGEADALGEIFDATAGDLLRIARRLASSRAEAEDLVQATFLAAIQRAASFDRERSLKPWLIGILVRQAALARRRSGRSKELEEQTASKAPEPSDILADREFAESLALALERLAPAEREVLVPLLLDEKRAVQIARELDKRPEAVHMRVHRGLARLRRLLPAGFGLGFAAVFLRRIALAHVRREVMHMARQSIATHPIPTTAGSFGASKLALGAGIAVAAGAVLWIARPWPATPRAKVSPPLAAHASALPAETVVLAGSSGGRAPVAPSASADPGRNAAVEAPSRWIVQGHLTGLQSGETLGSTLRIQSVGASQAIVGLEGVTTIAVSGGTATTPSISATIPADGAFQVDVSSLFTADPSHPPRELDLTVDHPRYLVAKGRVLVERGVVVQGGDGQPVLQLSCDVGLQLAAVVHGSVFAPDGSSATQCSASIYRMNGDSPFLAPENETTCAPGSEFRLRTAYSGSYVVRVSTADSVPATIPAQASIGEDLALPPIHLDAGSHLSGTVTAGGVVQPNVRVEAWNTNAPLDPQGLPISVMIWTPQGFVRTSGRATTDNQGRFTIQGLPAGEFHIATRGCALPADEMAFRTQSLPAVAAIAPSDNVSVPVSAAEIEFHFDGVDPAPSEIEMRITDSVGLIAGHSGTSWAPVKRIGFVPSWQYSVLFRIDGYEPYSATYTSPGPGELRVEQVSFTRTSLATLHVHLTSQDGATIQQAAFGFFLQPPPGQPALLYPTFSREAEAADGVFTLDAIRPGTYEVRVHVGGTFAQYAGYYRDAGFTVALPSGADETRELILNPGGRIRANIVTSIHQASFAARLLDAGGSECPTYFCRSTVDAGGESTWTSSPGYVGAGANDTFPNLAPGHYSLQVTRDPRPPLVVSVDVVAGQTSEITVDVDAP